MASESTVTLGGGPVADETLAEDSAFEGRVEGVLGGEVMLGVVGSDVLVDGVGGDGSGGGRNSEGAGSDVVVTKGLQRGIDSINGRAVGDSGAQVSDSITETKDEGFDKAVGSLGEQTHDVAVEEVSTMEDVEGVLAGGDSLVGSDVVVTEGLERGIDSVNDRGVGDSGGQVSDSITETKDEVFEKPLGSLGEQIHDVAVEEVSTMEDEEGVLARGDPLVGSDVVVTEGLERGIDSVNSRGVGYSGGQVSDSTTETKDEGFEEPVGSLGEQIHVVAVEEVSTMEDEEGVLERGDPLVGSEMVVTEGLERGIDSINGPGVGHSGGQVSDSITETKDEGFEDPVGSLGEQIHVVAVEEVSTVEDEEGVLERGDPLVGSEMVVTEGLERGIGSVNGRGVGDSGGQVSDSITENKDEGFEEPVGSLGEQIHAVAVEEVSTMEDEDGVLERGGSLVGSDVVVTQGLERGIDSINGLGVGDSGGQVSDSITETKEEGFEEPVGSLGEQIHVVAAEEVSTMEDEGGILERGDPFVGSDVVVTEGLESGIDSINGRGVGDLGGQVSDSITETKDEGFEEPAGSLGEHIHFVALEEVSTMEDEEGVLERGDPLVGGGGDAMEASVLCSSAQDSGTGTGLGVSLANSGSCEKAQVVLEEKVGVSVAEEISEREPIDKGVQKVIKPVEEGVGLLNQVELLSETGDVSNDGVWNPGIEDAVVCSSVALESSSLPAPIVANEVDVMADNEALKYKDEVLVVGAEEGNSNDPENHHSQVAHKDSAIPHGAESFDQQVEVAVGGDVGVMNEEEILQPEGSLCGSVENQQTKVNTVEESDDMDDKLSSYPTLGAPKSSVVSEIGEDAGEVAMLCGDSDSCIAQPPVAVGCAVADESKISISSPVFQNGGQRETLTTEDRALSTSDKKIDYTEDQQLKAESVSGGSNSSEREIAVCTESLSSYEHTEVVNGNQVSVMESNVSNSELEVLISDDRVTTVAFSEDDQNMKRETTCGIAESSNEQAFVAETEEVTVMHGEEVANIAAEVAGLEVLDGYTCIQNDEELNTVGGSMEEDGVAQANAEASHEQNEIDNKEESSVLDCQGIVQQEQTENDNKEESSILDCQGIVQVPASCASDENISLSEKDEELKVETLGKNTVEVPTTGVFSPQIGDHGSSSQTCTDSLESNVSLQDEKTDTEAQLADIPSHDEDRDQTMNMLIVDGKLAQLIGGDTQEVGGNMGFGFSECFDGSATGDLYLGNCVGHDVEVEEQLTDAEKLNQDGGQEVDVGEHSEGVEDKSLKQTTLRSENLAKVHQPNYLLVPENEAEFSVSDLVWGKVRSHPWWPGQIFDSADASEVAMKYFKKDCFLVAYFGDRTFAWNEPSLLKPFWSNFSQIEKQSNSEAFQSAVSCALEEVSRRVQFGLACSCIPKDVYGKIEYQDFENTGIREESSRRYGVDKSTGVSCFEPDNFLHYIRALAQSPSSGANRLAFLVAKAQLLAFSRLKGYHWLPKFQFCGGLLEKNADNPPLDEVVDHSLIDKQILSFKGGVKTGTSSSHKRKHNLKDIGYPRKKERTLSESMNDMENSSDGEDGSDLKVSSKPVSSSSGKKRKSGDFLSDGSDVQDRSIYAAHVSTNASPIPKPSFKIGECIRRAASQLTGSPSIVKCNNEKSQKVEDGSGEVPDNSQRGRISFPSECSSLDEMLSQLHLTALDPMKGYRLPTTIISFFYSFRNSISLGRYAGKQNSFVGRVGGRKKKASHGIGHSEEYEFDDVNDSYWTDMSIQNNSEEQPSGDNKNREGEFQLVAFDADKPNKTSRRSYSRKKRFSNGTHEMETEDGNGYIDKVKQDMSPTELLLNFSEGDSIPSVANLGKIFRRFGPLKDCETEVDVETSRARVVFKRGSDAQVALSSAGTFNIFGPATVNYQLNYTPSKLNYIPSISFETFPLATSQGLEDAT